MNSKFGMFSILIVGVMMLLIPVNSFVTAQDLQEYDDSQYDQDQYYDDVYQENIYKKSYYVNESYKKQDDKKSNDEPVIIIKNEPIVKKDKKKKVKEPPMLLVKKDVLYCDTIANGSGSGCGPNILPGPNSDRHIQECTATEGLGGEICENIDENFFKIIVTDDVEFPGAEEGTKLNLNGERYTVTEEMVTNDFVNFQCELAGFNSGFTVNSPDSGNQISICTEFEGECSGIIQDGELKECTIRNYVVNSGSL